MRILRGLRSMILPCGCLAGVYETYDGEVVTLLDTAEPSCTDQNHKSENQLPSVEASKAGNQK